MATRTPPPHLRKRPRHIPPPAVARDIDRTLELLRVYLARTERTQLSVQRRYGWGRTFLSQLFNKQKRLRFDQLLQVLLAIDIAPAEFFAELFGPPPVISPPAEDPQPIDRLFTDCTDVESLARLLKGVVAHLVQRGHLDADDVAALTDEP